MYWCGCLRHLGWVNIACRLLVRDRALLRSLTSSFVLRPLSSHPTLCLLYQIHGTSLFFLPDACFHHSKSVSPAWTSARNTSCSWTPSLWTIADTSFITLVGWWREKPIRKCRRECTFTRIRQARESSGCRKLFPSTNWSWRTTFRTNMAL